MVGLRFGKNPRQVKILADLRVRGKGKKRRAAVGCSGLVTRQRSIIRRQRCICHGRGTCMCHRTKFARGDGCAADPLQLSVNAASNKNAQCSTLSTRRSQRPCGSGDSVHTKMLWLFVEGRGAKPPPVRRARDATMRSMSADWLHPDRTVGGSGLHSPTAQSVRISWKCAAVVAVRLQCRTGSVSLVRIQAVQLLVKH